MPELAPPIVVTVGWATLGLGGLLALLWLLEKVVDKLIMWTKFGSIVVQYQMDRPDYKRWQAAGQPARETAQATQRAYVVYEREIERLERQAGMLGAAIMEKPQGFDQEVVDEAMGAVGTLSLRDMSQLESQPGSLGSQAMD